MPDTNSSILLLLLMGDRLHNNDWGNRTNTNLQAIEDAIAGATSIALRVAPDYRAMREEFGAVALAELAAAGKELLLGDPERPIRGEGAHA